MNTEPVALIPLQETIDRPKPEQQAPEAQPPILQRLGDLATQAVISLDIKAGAALEVAASALDTAKNYLKHKGGRLAVTGGGLASFLKSNTAHAEVTGPHATVTQAANGGIFSRNTPYREDTPCVIGQGIYPNDVLTLQCGVTDGSPVGQYNNTTWYFVHNNSRPEPNFWANDHFLDTPNTAGHMTPGVIPCPNKSSNPINSNQTSVANEPTSVFFSGTNEMDGIYNLPPVGDINYAQSDWSMSSCSNEKVAQNHTKPS